MDAHPRGTDWRSILLLIFSLGVSMLTIFSAIGTLLVLVFNESILYRLQGLNASPLVTVLMASALIAIGLLVLPLVWLSWQRLRDREVKPFSFSPLKPWVWILIPSLWVLAMLTATFFYDAPGASWYVPFLHFFSIGLPVYLVVRIAINRIPLGSAQRAWAVFGIGLTFSTFLAIIAEFIVIAFVLVIIGAYMGLNPEMAIDLQRLAAQFEQARDMESLFTIIGPYINNPLALIGTLTLLSVLVPMIEETFKSVGVWLVWDKLTSPAQGFAMGVLSGAGFALAESLFASITPDNAWAVTLSMRAVSGSMHMLATGLVGWGIASARLEKRYLKLVGMLLLAMFLHGTWNAGAVFTVAGGLRIMLSMPDFEPFGALLMFTGVGLLFTLIVGVIATLFILNAKLRTPTQSLAEEMIL